MSRSTWQVLVAVLAVLSVPPSVSAQAQPTGGQAQASQPQPIDDQIDAAESDNLKPTRHFKWNEYDGRAFSINVGGGYLWDYVDFTQDDVSKEQIDTEDQWKLRDARVLLRGRLKFKRPTTWSSGIMYDKSANEWVFRQTGIMVSVPEIWGDIFVGRTKSGFSLNKVMVGYGGWSIERSQINDAAVPILADGVKWLGYVPKAHILWNLGVFGDALSKKQGFETLHHQVTGRFAWLPRLSADGGTLLHIGVSERYGKPQDNEVQLRARPGAWGSPYFVDTGTFDATRTWATGLEIYYRPHSVTMGTELIFEHVAAPNSGDPYFHGGEAFVSWMLTGEVRSYNTRGGYFNQISPLRSVFGGGPGAWEIVGHGSWVDLDSGAITGGKYWRLTPMLNWYLSDNARLEFVYGYGSLNRFNMIGKTQFFQTRIQLQL